MAACSCGPCFFNETATTEIYTLSLHDALPICQDVAGRPVGQPDVDPLEVGLELAAADARDLRADPAQVLRLAAGGLRSEEHTSELQSRQYRVCRLLLEQKQRHRASQRLGARRA